MPHIAELYLHFTFQNSVRITGIKHLPKIKEISIRIPRVLNNFELHQEVKSHPNHPVMRVSFRDRGTTTVGGSNVVEAEEAMGESSAVLSEHGAARESYLDVQTGSDSEDDLR